MTRDSDTGGRPEPLQPHGSFNRTGLPDRLKQGIEQLAGLSLEDVRVRFNSSEPAKLQAEAFAQGSEIHLAPGHERHLPHEAWHVVQQKQGRVRPTRSRFGHSLNTDPALELEADRMGARAAQSSGVRAPGLSAARGQPTNIVQRKLSPDEFRKAIASARGVLEKLIADLPASHKNIDKNRRDGLEKLLSGNLPALLQHTEELRIEAPEGGEEACLALRKDIDAVKRRVDRLLNPKQSESLPAVEQSRKGEKKSEAERPMSLFDYKRDHPEGHGFYAGAIEAVATCDAALNRATLLLHDHLELSRSRPESAPASGLEAKLKTAREALTLAYSNMVKLQTKAQSHQGPHAARETKLVTEIKLKHAIASARMDALMKARERGGFYRVSSEPAAKGELKNLLQQPGEEARQQAAGIAATLGQAANVDYLEKTAAGWRQEEIAVDDQLRAAEREGIRVAWTIRKLRLTSLEKIGGEAALAAAGVSEKWVDLVMPMADAEKEIRPLVDAALLRIKVERPHFHGYAEERKDLHEKERAANYAKLMLREIGNEAAQFLKGLPGGSRAIDKGIDAGQEEIDQSVPSPPKINIRWELRGRAEDLLGLR